MSHEKRAGRDAIDELIRALDELKELDRRRNAHAPGSVAHDAASLEVDLHSRRLMDRFRDLEERRKGDPATDAELTRPIDVKGRLERGGSALLN